MLRVAMWVVALATAIAVCLLVWAGVVHHTLGEPADPRITRTMRADPMARFRPSQTIRLLRSLQTGAGGRGTWQSVAHDDRTFLVPTATSRAAFRDTVRAARAAGWHIPDAKPADYQLGLGEVDYRTAGKTTLPGVPFTLELTLRSASTPGGGTTPPPGAREIGIYLKGG